MQFLIEGVFLVVSLFCPWLSGLWFPLPEANLAVQEVHTLLAMNCLCPCFFFLPLVNLFHPTCFLKTWLPCSSKCSLHSLPLSPLRWGAVLGSLTSSKGCRLSLSLADSLSSSTWFLSSSLLFSLPFIWVQDLRLPQRIKTQAWRWERADKGMGASMAPWGRQNGEKGKHF